MSPLRRLGLIGFGAIGRSFIEACAREAVPGHSLAAVCVRDYQLADASRAAKGALVTTDMAAFLSLDLDIVIEAAGHEVVRNHGPSILQAGHELYLLSVGAIADRAVQERLEAAAACPGAGRIVIPSGAAAGLDGLRALRENGLTSVTYTSLKPPGAWSGTPAESEIDLQSLIKSVTIFTGSARASALLYPKNANLAAAIALAGLGLDQTTVRLIADPYAIGNTGIIEAQSESSRLRVELSGQSYANNPKSSGIVALSIIAALKNSTGPIVYV
ncbi:MAG: Aspartate dehydrogenase [Bradyrhizobium sp.]|nr:Aspartate dehydrogenase [Bradyrhizobium sp.]